ncbi:MAG: endonuclease/exonuclease/phosphatase family protein [Bryobacterales bacterium]|nr:endonuclease/exonuclease/phosphatase family protein [Bryobacterales bacterium]
MKDVSEFLQRQSAALLLLQEVDVNAQRTGRRNIAEKLSRSLRMPYLFAVEFEELSQGRQDSPAYHGQAILTSLAASSPRMIRFKHQTGFWRSRWYLPNWPVFQRRMGGRLALVAEVDFGGRPVVVYNAHLESRGSEGLRKLQVEEILADARQYPPGAPILIAGDFNTRKASSPAVAALLGAGFHMAVGQQATTTRGSALDWIFVRGPRAFEKRGIHGDAKASDHFPLTVVLHLDPQSAAPQRRTSACIASK